MARLIDADAYIEEYQVAADMARKIGGEEMTMLADFYCEVIKEIKKRPTVDAVPVVLCKDCKDHDRCEVEDLLRYFDPTSEPYCSVGERKANDC